MTLDGIRTFLGWAAILNLIITAFWFLLILSMRDWIYSLHRRWFSFSLETFESINYGGIASYKAATWMFFIIPYVVLRLFF